MLLESDPVETSILPQLSREKIFFGVNIVIDTHEMSSVDKF